ncbi:quinate permease [Capronia epimyces CBS 606.96]|uniref:Quinate transporter n=1 Tax=Capronia epimyces CBS 606.96 TaxID=1182542 RepID=W9XFE2_9EURO|nr:quinate permease [Capronia epimyces CBS 606.96]EXJ78918.1 quinate permease [Capronia epimyces CBS 606.96]
MGGNFLKKVEDRPTPKEVYNWKVYFVAAVASSGAATIGYDSAFIGGTLALTSFRNEMGLDHMGTSRVNLLSANIVSCYQAGAFFGSFLAYPAGHFLGRRIGLMIFSLLFVIGAGVMLATDAGTGFGYLYGGRTVAGLGIGAISNLIPIYLAEISPPAIRGRLVGMWEIGWQIGGLYGISTTMAESHTQWLIPFAIQLIPGGLLTVGAFFLPETPRWLITNGKRSQGIKSLCFLRNLPADHPYLLVEVQMIDQALEELKSSIGTKFSAPFKEVWQNKKIAYRFFLGGALFFWQNGSGINAINYYSPTVFRNIGVTGTNTSLLTTGVFGAIKTVVTFIWILFMIDQMGRRNLLMYGALCGSICLWVVGGYIAVAEPTEHPTNGLSSGGIAAMVFFYLYTVSYTPSWSGTPWVVNSEMFDQNVRTLAQAFAASNNWLWNFLVARFTPQMFAEMKYGVWFFFASLQLLSIPFVYFLLPETKSIPLECMDMLFDKSLKPRHAHKEVINRLQNTGEQIQVDIVEGNGTKHDALHVENDALHVERMA